MGIKLMISFFAAAVIVLLLWLARGAMLTPVRTGENERLDLVLTVSGSSRELEHTVDGLLWLSQNGTLRGHITVRDAGMDAETRRTAELLEKKGVIKLIH